MEPLTNLPEVREIEQSISQFLIMAQTIKVNSLETLEIGNDYFLQIKARIKAIDEKLQPKRDIAYKAYQEWLTLIKELKTSLEKALTNVNSQITSWKKEQDKIRVEEAERKYQEAIKIECERRQKEEAEKLAQAVELEAAGAYEEADALITETIEEIEKPIEIVIAPPETPKVKLMGAAMRESWDFEIEKETLIPRQYLIPDLKKIGGIVRALKGETNIPGIKVFRVDKMVATGR